MEQAGKLRGVVKMQNMVSLEAGYGSEVRYPANPRGDVNCDVDKPHFEIPNFVRCEARNLPLKDRNVVVTKMPYILSVNFWKDKNHKHHLAKRWFEKYGNCQVEILPYDLSKFPICLKKIAYKSRFIVEILPDELRVTIKR